METENSGSSMEISVEARGASNHRELSVEPREESDRSFEYCSESDTYRARYDGSSVRTSTAVIEAIARLTGEEPTQMPPVQTTVDLDALDTLTRSETSDGVLISFVYEGYDITIRSD